MSISRHHQTTQMIARVLTNHELVGPVYTNTLIDLPMKGETILFTDHFQEMTPEAEIISTRYTKSIIKSCAALSYIEAQARMDDR